MNEKKYEKRLGFQKKMIEKQSEQIQSLNSQIEKLKLELEEKDELINSVADLKNELTQNIADIKEYKKEYGKLIEELRKMKEIMNREVYHGRWRLIRLLMK